MKRIIQTKAGVSIVEMLVVVAIFAVLGVVVTQSLALSLRGTNKSKNTSEVRQNVEYVASIIERKIRNADDIDTSGASCTMAPEQIDLVFGEETHTISCQESGGLGRVYINEDGTDRALSDSDVDFDCTTSPVFACNTVVEPPYVDISLNATHATQTGVEGAEISLQTRVSLRNYK